MKKIYKTVLIASVLALLTFALQYAGVLLSQKYDADQFVIEFSELPREDKKKEIEKRRQLMQQLQKEKQILKLRSGIACGVLIVTAFLLTRD